jgi:lysophospholipase L1-like esterase
LIIIGGNDVTHRTTPAEAVPLLVSAIEHLREAGAEVVVGTCPDLGTIQPVAPPLRQIVRGWSRWLAQAQIEAAPKAGARVVALGSLLGPEFAAAPRELFGPDRFHPSAAGYTSAAAAILPSLAAAAGYWPDDEDTDSLSDGQLLAISFVTVPKPRTH